MKTIKLLLVTVTALALFSACSTGAPESAAAAKTHNNSGEKLITLTAEQFTSSGMALGKVTQQLFSERVQTTGMVDVPPQYKADVSVYYGGTVKNIHLLVGQTVAPNAVLFTMENPEYVQMQQDYLRAKSRLNYLKAEYERQKMLLKDNVASQKNFLKAESDYKTVLADFNALDKKLRLLNIDPQTLNSGTITTAVPVKAPIGGYVTAVNITRGQYLSPNEVAVSLVNTEHIHLELNVFEKDITRLRKGQPIRFRLPDNGSEYFEGEVFLVGKAVYGADRTINVHGHLRDHAHRAHFIPGMYIEAEILVDEVRRPALPSDAVVELDGTHYVLVKQSFENDTYTFAQRSVKVGASNDGFTEIVNADVLGNREILVKGAFELIQ